jgi:hypothetical protein
MVTAQPRASSMADLLACARLRQCGIARPPSSSLLGVASCRRPAAQAPFATVLKNAAAYGRIQVQLSGIGAKRPRAGG